MPLLDFVGEMECFTPEPANDREPLFTRMLDLAARGRDFPELLGFEEIEQISIALLAFLSRDKKASPI